ncbi:MAG TPA: hypothetical protein VEI07_11910, partial [Planctomycetaceae bacterium]|nr:hypothetical protein [Planctomycetaceae bacterium]
MSAPQIEAAPIPELQPPAAASPRVLRVWPAVVIAAGYWVAMTVISQLDLVISHGFFSAVGASLLTGLLFLTWLLTRRAIPGRDRLILCFALIVAGAIVKFLGDGSVGVVGLLFAGPGFLCTGWAVWLLIARRWSPATIRNGLLVVLALVCAQFSLIRINGIDGQQKASISPRWERSAEDLYLAERAAAAAASPASGTLDSEANRPLVLSAGDWPGFRGENRQGELHGTKIATDWKAAPPKLVWKHRIGPAWSSFVVLGNRLFTQEQRGEEEAVVCLDAA